jgi:GTP-binding protein Era
MKKPRHRAGFVAILGRPNAGKSTLLNALMGTKLAIVASKPQTTRTSIQGVLTLPEAQIVFLDTPGIHKSTTPLNKRMMDTVRAAADAPDVVLFVIDSLARFTEQDAQAVDLAKKAGAPVIAVLNKVDWLEEKPKLLALIERYRAISQPTSPSPRAPDRAWTSFGRRSSRAFPKAPPNIRPTILPINPSASSPRK